MASLHSSAAQGILRFDNILNFRDVGLYTGGISGNSILKPGMIYRSAVPDNASPSDRNTLESSLGIHTILDLRTNTERSLHPTSNPIPIFTQRINLSGPFFRLLLIFHLSFLSILHLLFLILTFQRLAAISVLATTMGPRGLSGLAEDTLNASWREMRAIFARLADREAWPVLVHCTQGKDRTGLVVLLLSRLAGVDVEACAADYMLTQTELSADREKRLLETRRFGLPDGFVDCEKGWVQHVLNYLDERWGGVEQYLKWCGVQDDDVLKVKGILTITNNEIKQIPVL